MEKEKNTSNIPNVFWKGTILALSVLIVGIGAFLLFRLFTSNPLEGKWVAGQENTELSIRGDGTVRVTYDTGEGKLSFTIPYDLDKEQNQFVIYAEEDRIREERFPEDFSGEKELYRQFVLEFVDGAYQYSVEGDTLTLTEMEYGEQKVFKKK